jgi:hypothetical protein
VDAVAVLEILVEEVKTQVPVSQVVRELKNQRFSAITVKSMDIMHMSAGRDSIIRTSKVKISQTTQITKLALCLWCIVAMPRVVEMPNIVSPVECNVAQASPCDIWYLDSGCSNHMTGNIELFSSLDESVQTKVTLGTYIQVTVLGKGSINILTKQGEQKVMPDVYYVSGLKHNLMST